MPNNLVVDVASINADANNINVLYNESQNPKYLIMGQQATPLHVDESIQCMRMEAALLSSETIKDGWGTSTVTYGYYYETPFKAGPVVSVILATEATGLDYSITIDNSVKQGRERIIISINRLDGQKWVKNKEAFTIHLIAIGY